VRVDPYSFQTQTPQGRLAALNQLVSQILGPMLPLFQQQGVGLDLHAYVEKWAKYNDNPDVADLVTYIQPPEQGEVSQPDQPKMPASTTRNYNRRSSATGATTMGRDMEHARGMQASSMNGKPAGM
jgi:hypothetical protein